jgi:hypothetical protein
MSALKAWEIRLGTWLEKHPVAADRIDHILEESVDYGQSATMAVFILPWCYLLAFAAIIVALIFRHPWNWIAGAFVANALLFSAATVYLFFDDRRQTKKWVGKAMSDDDVCICGHCWSDHTDVRYKSGCLSADLCPCTGFDLCVPKGK